MTEQQTSAPFDTGARLRAWSTARRLGVFAALLVAALAPATVAVGAPQPVRLVFGLALIAWAPGHCAAVATKVWDPFLFVVVTIAVSLSLCVVTSSTLLYLGIWSASTTMLAIGLITAAIAAAWLLEGRAR